MHTYALRHAFIQNGRHDIGRQRGQVEQSAHVAVVDFLAGGEFGDGPRFARFQYGQPAIATGQRQLNWLGGDITVSGLGGLGEAPYDALRLLCGTWTRTSALKAGNNSSRRGDANATAVLAALMLMASNRPSNHRSVASSR
ncbi:MAG: hypothetical protein IAE88_09290 [Rhodobacteraceae bacterium]|nr:hypothetical protein [Paracoccaceae bacterium]